MKTSKYNFSVAVRDAAGGGIGEGGLLYPALVLHVGLKHFLPPGEGGDSPQPTPRGCQSAAQKRQHHAARGHDGCEHGRPHACLVGVRCRCD